MAAEKNEDYRQALHYTKAILSQCPDNVELHCKVIELLSKDNRLNEATDYSQKLQNDFRQSPVFLYWRGRVLIYNGNTDLGRKHFMEALRLNPDYVDAQRMIKKIK